MNVIELLITALLITPLVLSGCEQGRILKDKKVPLSMDKYRGPTVTLSGRAICPDHESSAITIFASRRYRGPADIILAEIPTPGEYSVKIPKDLGDIHIRAVSLVPGAKSNISRGIIGFSGRYKNNPLKISSVDIKGVDLVITKRPFLLMDFYPGPTVEISGEIIFPRYEGGEIVISVSSKSRGPTDIAVQIIPQPGKYFLKVPRNFGNIYLRAKSLNSIEGRQLNKLVGRYEQNPLKVGASDINGIDIISEF